MRRREKNVTGTSVSPPGYNDSQSLFFASSCTLVTFVLTQDRYWTLDSGHVIQKFDILAEASKVFTNFKITQILTAFYIQSRKNSYIFHKIPFNYRLNAKLQPSVFE